MILSLIYLATAAFLCGLFFAIGAMGGVLVVMSLSDFSDWWDR